jgi:hypothetical protein
MAIETIAILRTLLYQANKAKTTKEIINAISVMLSKEDIATVKEQLAIDAAEAQEEK